MTSSQAQSPGGPGPTTSSDETAAPDIRVLGDATPEEVAAVVAVLSAVTGGSQAALEDAGSAWASHAAVLRTPVLRGPGAWRTPLRP